MSEWETCTDQINVDRFWCERTTGDAMYWRKRYYGQLKVKTYYLQTLSFSRSRLNYLWCFYQLLSFWRHPFTSEDPLVSKWCDAKCLQFCSNEETNSILNGRRTIPLRSRLLVSNTESPEQHNIWWTLPLTLIIKYQLRKYFCVMVFMNNCIYSTSSLLLHDE